MSSAERTLLLIDGTAMAYRAFYAIAELSRKDGTPTNAVYGFIKLFRNLVDTWKPTHAAVVFDKGMPQARLELLPTYKAQRKEMPDSLRDQIEAIKEYLDAATVPCLFEEGEEADDILASLAAFGGSPASKVLIATSDKDMFQLVNDTCLIAAMTKAGVVMGAAEVKEKTGVEPRQIVDWLAMVGDTADNIPGVPGVGEKTAAKLMAQFGTIEQLWERIGEVASDRIRAALLESRHIIERNRKMMTLKFDVNVPREWSLLELKKPNPDRVLPFLDKMEFQGMARAMRDEASKLF